MQSINLNTFRFPFFQQIDSKWMSFLFACFINTRWLRQTNKLNLLRFDAFSCQFWSDLHQCLTRKKKQEIETIIVCILYISNRVQLNCVLYTVCRCVCLIKFNENSDTFSDFCVHVISILNFLEFSKWWRQRKMKTSAVMWTRFQHLHDKNKTPHCCILFLSNNFLCVGYRSISPMYFHSSCATISLS